MLRLVGDNLDEFLSELSTLAPPAGRGHYAFRGGDGLHLGFVQIIHGRGRRIRIHRIWAHSPRQGHGSAIMHTLGGLADRHGVELELKVIPIGRKPYPMTRDQLHAWYLRHGFEGPHRKMVRKPRATIP
jgi:GNAT superfamily N-acetyltransferase